ncbi:MAG: copper resistance protein NlpE N-terminal domain-containing protein [Porphyromonadaceae bacterium]|nr:copper resistance protein NlpE N-terminal domain-containing protein [Porphyromonadaceae bacterium]
MKKIFALSLVALALGACSGGKTQTATADSVATDSMQMVEATVAGAGIYTGVLPNADATGSEVTLELKNDMTFVELSKVESGNNETGEFREEGTFTLNGEELVLTYSTSSAVTKALLRGDSIQLLDAEGNIPKLPYVLKLKK